jgi:hypothetical protein
MRVTLFSLDDFDQQNQYTPDYIQIADRKFQSERVVVDNHQFSRCSFQRCTLIHSGGPFGFSECDFDADSTPVLTGAAQRGLILWKALVLDNPGRSFPG